MIIRYALLHFFLPPVAGNRIVGGEKNWDAKSRRMKSSNQNPIFFVLYTVSVIFQFPIYLEPLAKPIYQVTRLEPWFQTYGELEDEEYIRDEILPIYRRFIIAMIGIP